MSSSITWFISLNVQIVIFATFETVRHLSVCGYEHLNTEKASVVYIHINENVTCKSKCDQNCFSVLNSVYTKMLLRIKETMHITQQKPVLNQQVSWDLLCEERCNIYLYYFYYCKIDSIFVCET